MDSFIVLFIINGINSYGKIKSILENNCYELPLNDLSEGGDYANIG